MYSFIYCLMPPVVFHINCLLMLFLLFVFFMHIKGLLPKTIVRTNISTRSSVEHKPGARKQA